MRRPRGRVLRSRCNWTPPAAGALPELADELDAVHDRHVPVGHDEVEREARRLEALERVDAVLGLDDRLHADLVKDLDLDLSRERGVVDEKDLHAFASPREGGA